MSQIKHGRLGEGEEVVSKGRGQFRKAGGGILKGASREQDLAEFLCAHERFFRGGFNLTQDNLAQNAFRGELEGQVIIYLDSFALILATVQF